MQVPEIREPEPSDEEDGGTDLEASFSEVDLDAPSEAPLPPPRSPDMVRQDSGARPVIGSTFIPSRTPSPRLPPAAAPLGRLGMVSSRSSIDSSGDAPDEAVTPAADPTFASTSSFDFGKVASGSPPLEIVVANDAEGTFESVPIAHGVTSARAAEKQPERPPSVRSYSEPTVSSNGHASAEEEEEQPRATTPPPTQVKSPVSPTAGKGGLGKTTGASALQKVMSRTRQKDLPPKEKQEDDKHLKEFTNMMAQSRDIEKKRREENLAKRKSKDVEMQAHLPSWEKDILPNWKVVLSDPNLRKLWWGGTMPARFRANLWSASIGNALAIGKSSYTRSIAQARSLLSAGRIPADVLQALEADMEQTLPRLKLFQREGPMWDDLHDLLLAYSVFNRDRPYYPQGASWPAALLLISMAVPDAFVCLANLVEKSFLKSFYTPKRDEIDAYYRIFGTLLADKMPPVYRNFLAIDIRPQLYLGPWLTTCFARFLPVDCATRIFDVFVLEGDSFLFRVALAVLEALEARLFNPDGEAVAAIFTASDKGTRSVVARAQGFQDESEVLAEDVYAATTGGEDRIFALLEQMEWKERTWVRLVERELPE